MILDVGSMEIGTITEGNRGGTVLSALLESSFHAHCTFKYIEVDMSEGPNVHVVIQPTKPFPFANNTFDFIVTSSALEHDPMFWVTFLHMIHVLRPGGFIYISVPMIWQYHPYPLDAWRFTLRSAKILEQWAHHSGYNITLIHTAIILTTDVIMIFYKSDDVNYVNKSNKLIAVFEEFGTLLDLQCNQPQNVVNYYKTLQNTNILNKQLKLPNGVKFIVNSNYEYELVP